MAPNWTLRLTLGTLVAALLLPGSLALTEGPAVARGGAAPVTAPDVVRSYAGNAVFPAILKNDSDPEGDKLDLCAEPPEKYRRVDWFSEAGDREPYIEIGERARPGSYTFTYAACDGTSRTPGTLTLVVQKPPRITLHAVRSAHGRVRASSRAPFKVRLTFGDFNRDDPEGVVTIPRKGSVVFSTRYHRTDWIARTVDGTFLDRGRLGYVPRTAG